MTMQRTRSNDITQQDDEENASRGLVTAGGEGDTKAAPPKSPILAGRPHPLKVSSVTCRNASSTSIPLAAATGVSWLNRLFCAGAFLLASLMLLGLAANMAWLWGILVSLMGLATASFNLWAKYPLFWGGIKGIPIIFDVSGEDGDSREHTGFARVAATRGYDVLMVAWLFSHEAGSTSLTALH